MELIRAGRLAGITGLTRIPGMAAGGGTVADAALEKVPAARRGRAGAGGGRFRLVCPGDAEWPVRAGRARGRGAGRAVGDRAVADLGFSCLRSVAVTGARAATAYGSYLGSELGASLAARGWTVVSGASFGVDASAHRGALAADGVTIAVTAGGLDVPYPAAHADLFDCDRRAGRARQRGTAGGASQQAAVPGPATGSSPRSPPGR